MRLTAWLAMAMAMTMGTAPAVRAQPAAAASTPANAADLREQVLRLPVSVKDLYGREERRDIAVTVFRQPGDGPFPLLVMSHGRAPGDRRAGQGRQRFEAFARYMVDKGFAVFVPTRVGYGDTYGDFDPEYTGDCNSRRPQAAMQAASDQVLAVVAHARGLPWVNATRWVAAGQSVGGAATLAVAARHPPGLVAAINFAGGIGGDPDTRPGNPCSPTTITRMLQAQAAGTTLPILWVYWANDLYWGADWPRRWAQAWTDSGGRALLHQLPAAGTDGHNGVNIDMDHWVPLVEAYLAEAGFTRSGMVPRPPASGFAAVADASKLPASATMRDGLYQRFLAAKPPRAFALGADGAAGFATGDSALGRAVGQCQARRGAPCRLYAVDDDVVWVP